MTRRRDGRGSNNSDNHGKVENLTPEQLKNVKFPHQFTPDESRFVILARIQMNLQRTGHPFHHLTMSGVVVDADPTLEQLISQLTDAASAVPVNRKYYGFDATEKQ